MFYNNNDDDDGNSVPSWLKQEEQLNEKAPLIASRSVYESQPSTILDVEEDYGSGTPAVTNDKALDDNPTWAEDPPTAQLRNVDEEKVAGKYEDSYSSDDDIVEEPEGKEFGTSEDTPPSTENWAETKKKKRKKVWKPTRSCCHTIFIGIQILAILGNLCMIATQVIPLFICDVDAVQQAIRGYLAIFAFVFLFTELEWIQSPFLQNWISRGFLYSFLGVVEIEQHFAMSLDGTLSALAAHSNQHWNVEWTSVFINISSWWMVGIGCLHFVLGVFCMQRIRNKCRKHYQGQLKHYKESMNPPPTPLSDEFHVA